MKTPIKNQSSTTGTHTPAGRPAVKQAVFHVEQLTRRTLAINRATVAFVVNHHYNQMFERMLEGNPVSARRSRDYADGIYLALRMLTGEPRVLAYDTFEALLAVTPKNLTR